MMPILQRRGSSSPTAWVYPGALIDLDFVNRRYWWGGALHDEADATLTNCTFDASGMTSLAPGGFIVAGLTPPSAVCIGAKYVGVSTPASSKRFATLADSAGENYAGAVATNVPAVQANVRSGNVQQMAISDNITAGVAETMAMRCKLNDGAVSFNGAAVTTDTILTEPVSMDRIYCGCPAVALARFVVPGSVLDNAGLQALALAIA